MKSFVRMFVLAGGNGERLFPFSSLIPKCLIPVAGKPCVRWVIDDAMKQGFTDIVMCINKKDESNFKYEFRDLNLKYSVSEECLGTVAEVSCARGLIDGTFILRYGDDLTDVAYDQLLGFHRKKQGLVTLAVTTKLMLPVGIVEKDEDGQVRNFIEKPTLDRPSWVGIAVLEPRALSYFRPGEDIAMHALPRMLKAGESIYCFDTHSSWYDVGNIEHWRRADEYFKNNKTPRNNC